MKNSTYEWLTLIGVVLFVFSFWVGVLLLFKWLLFGV